MRYKWHLNIMQRRQAFVAPHLRSFSSRAPVTENDECSCLLHFLECVSLLSFQLWIHFLAFSSPVVDGVDLGAQQAHKPGLVHWALSSTITLLL